MRTTKRLLFSEIDASREVIRNLIDEIDKLKGEQVMGKVLTDGNGVLYLAHEYDVIENDEAAVLLEDCQNDVTLLQGLLNPPAQPETPIVPDDNPPAQPEQPVDQSVTPAIAAADPLPAPSDTPTDQAAPVADQPPVDPLTLQ